MTDVTTTARAKINLYLKVTGKRPDGYHDLVTVMQSLSLSDTLHFARTGGQELRLDCGGALPGDKSNLIYRAAEAYFAASGARFGVDITLEKRIPMAAGLGGGSADAAATLRALALLDGNRLSEEELLAIAARLGADVPFCLVGGSRLCRGIGERMEPIENNLGGYLVITIAGEGVSTPQAFGALDAIYGDFATVEDLPPVALLDAMKKGDIHSAVPHFYNMFEEAIMPLRPAVSACKKALLDHGAAAAMMSGSGPSVWGLFEEEKSARAACAALLESGARAFLCRAE